LTRPVREILSSSEELYRLLVHHSPDAVVFFDLSETILAANEGAAQLLGMHDAEELVGQNALALLSPEERPRAREDIARLLGGERLQGLDYRVVRRDGNVIPVEMSVSVIRDGDGVAQCFYVLFHDIAVRRQLEAAVQRSEALHRSLIQQIPAITYLADNYEVGGLRYVSPQVERLLGYTPEEWLTASRAWSDCLHPSDRERVLAELDRARQAQEPFVSDYRLVAKDGRAVWFHDVSNIVYDDQTGSTCIQGVLLDISGRKELEEKLTHLAGHDALTDLPNRRILEETLERVVARARRGGRNSLLLIDVNHFKHINDTLGHEAGDRTLLALAQVMGSSLRGGDILFRQGGDEFVALLFDVNCAGACEVAERLRMAVEQGDFVLGGTRLKLSVSIGLVLVDGQESAGELLRRADARMYAAKRRGGNRVEVSA
jgi:diguanylate cyclase (GGDEF)-like protein/PAS domain S-box-containing protein